MFPLSASHFANSRKLYGQVKTWDKVNSGLIKMYKAEVLAKLPVAQHIYFGPLLPFPIPLEAEKQHDDGGVQKDEHGHIHVRGEMWGDCKSSSIPFES